METLWSVALYTLYLWILISKKNQKDVVIASDQTVMNEFVTGGGLGLPLTECAGGRFVGFREAEQLKTGESVTHHSGVFKRVLSPYAFAKI